jgi:hypothetical protein
MKISISLAVIHFYVFIFIMIGSNLFDESVHDHVLTPLVAALTTKHAHFDMIKSLIYFLFLS